MVERRQFLEACEIMAENLPVVGPAKRMDGLYKLFKHEPIDAIQRAARWCAMNLDKFPVPRQFADQIAFAKRQTATQEGTQVDPCEYCHGDGVVFCINTVTMHRSCFRCLCANAAKFRNYPDFFGAGLKDWEIENTIEPSEYLSDKLSKGLAILKRMKLKIPEKLENKINTLVKLGRESADIPF